MRTAEEKHKGSSLIESFKLTWEKTSWKVSSASSTICAHCFSCLLANLIHQLSYYWANPFLPGLIHIPAGLWPGWYHARIWGLGESLIFLPSGCPLLDGDGRLTKGPTRKLCWRGSAPLLSFATMPPRSRETLLTPPSPPPKAGTPLCQINGITCIDVASPVGIGWRKHPQRECSHLDRGNGWTLKGYREC